MNKLIPIAGLLITITFGCANKIEQEKEAPPHIAKEIESVQTKMKALPSIRAAKKAAFYEDMRKQTVAVQNMVSKRH